MLLHSWRGFEIVMESDNFNSPSLKRILRGLGVLQSGIRADFKL
jgi:hypothetical protein